MEDEIRVLVLTGTIGAGKTTVAEALSVELHERRIRHALLDLDWLGQVYPPPVGHEPFGYELAIANLRAAWPNFVDAGVRCALIAGTLLDQEQKNRLGDALGLAQVTVALLQAPHEVLQDRIRTRDIGTLQHDFLSRSTPLAKQIEAAAIHDFVVTNDGTTSPTEVAQDLLLAGKWI